MKYARSVAAMIGITTVLFGVSQIVRPKKWEAYVPDSVDAVLPVEKSTILRVHGMGNVLLGLALVTNTAPKLTRNSAGVWWIWVSLFCGRYDWRVAVRDITIGGVLLGLDKDDTKA